MHRTNAVRLHPDTVGLMSEKGDGGSSCEDFGLQWHAERRLAAIVESSDDAIIGKDREGTIMSWNRGAELLYGYKACEVLGRSIIIIVPEDRREDLRGLLERLSRGERVRHHETVRVTKSGTRIAVALTMSPVFEGSRVVGISTIARDITEQRWLAATLDRTLAELQAALAQSQGAEAASRRFLADAAHQLRSPFATIQVCADTLALPLRREEHQLVVADLRRETARAAKLISSMLKMARVDQGLSLTAAPCDVAALCDEEVARYRTLGDKPEARVEIAGDADASGEFDANALREALANLLDNARRHALERVIVRVEERDGWIEVRVVDDGPGVADDQRERMFERFVTLDGKGGSGLGLAIARAVARSHGGDLIYEGGAFLLRLPRPPHSSFTPSLT